MSMIDRMDWINPSKRRRKIKRCEYCGSDITTPYKGVHNETELINGFPAPCRNNGRLNLNIEHGYIKGHEPKENHKWFVEHPETHLWWSGYKWTNDPNEAFGCDLESTARRYAVFQRIETFMITEHEFLAP